MKKQPIDRRRSASERFWLAIDKYADVRRVASPDVRKLRKDEIRRYAHHWLASLQ